MSLYLFNLKIIDKNGTVVLYVLKNILYSFNKHICNLKKKKKVFKCA